MAVATPTRPSTRHEPRAFVVARRIYGGFFVAMAAVNAVVAGVDLDVYAAFADTPLVGLYGDLWRDVVAPNLEVVVPLLIAFELVVGLTLWWARERGLRTALWAIVAFHLALVPANPYAASNLLLVLVPLGLLWWHAALRPRPSGLSAGPGDPISADPGDPISADPGDPISADPGDPISADPGDPISADPGDG
jgi:hypothetical protein